MIKTIRDAGDVRIFRGAGKLRSLGSQNRGVPMTVPSPIARNSPPDLPTSLAGQSE